jgi:PAS domain S-box-containing protein
MIGKTDYDFLPEHQARKTFENDNNIMKTGQPIIDEVEKLTGKDGSERWVSVTKIPRYSSEGKIIGTMGISRDVTKRVKETKETEKYKKVAIGQNLRIIELRDRVKDLITEMEKDK